MSKLFKAMISQIASLESSFSLTDFQISSFFHSKESNLDSKHKKYREGRDKYKKKHYESYVNNSKN